MVRHEVSTIQTNEDAVAVLSNPSNCGLLLLIEQLLRKARAEKNVQRIRSCRLAEKLLSNFKKTSIVVTPKQSESSKDFVHASIAKAVEITTNPEGHHGLIQTFASTFLSILEDTKDPHKETTEKLINAWKDFSAHWLRDEIHKVARLTEEPV